MEPTTVVLPRPRTRASNPTVRRTVPMTAGADAPLRALRDAPRALHVRCHPCDEAIVRHLLVHVGRGEAELVVDESVQPGELTLSVRLPVAI